VGEIRARRLLLRLRLRTIAVLIALFCFSLLVFRHVFVVPYLEQAVAGRQFVTLGAKMAFEDSSYRWLRLWLDRETCRKVVMINLEHCHISDKEVGMLRRLPWVRSVYLGGNPITDNALIDITDLQNLETLSLFGTNITDDGLDNLSEIKGLAALDIHNSAITDEGLRKLARVQKLQELTIGSLREDKRIPFTALKSLPELQIIVWDSGRISADDINQLLQLPKLQEASLLSFDADSSLKTFILNQNESILQFGHVFAPPYHYISLWTNRAAPSIYSRAPRRQPPHQVMRP